MKNIWLKNKVGTKDYWTFEIIDSEAKVMVSETIVDVNDCPTMRVVEKLEVVENGEKVWKPVLVVWEDFQATYTDLKFIENHSQIRLMEVDGNTVGILRHYSKSGEHIESWVMHDLCLADIKFPFQSVSAKFTFHHALYLTEK